MAIPRPTSKITPKMSKAISNRKYALPMRNWNPKNASTTMPQKIARCITMANGSVARRHWNRPYLMTFLIRAVNGSEHGSGRPRRQRRTRQYSPATNTNTVSTPRAYWASSLQWGMFQKVWREGSMVVSLPRAG